MEKHKDLVWPSECSSSFNHIVESAITLGVNLRVRRGTVVHVIVPIQINNNYRLHIYSDENDPGPKPVIFGCCHSVFIVGGRCGLLTLSNMDVRQNFYDIDKRRVGAVVFCRNKGTFEARNCILLSEYGFSTWIVQHAKVSLNFCDLSSERRSGCVLFGEARLHLEECIIQNCAQHGICLRGSACVQLLNSRIQNSGVRGIYGYHAVSMRIIGCVIEGTHGESNGAIEVSGCGPNPLKGWKIGKSLESRVDPVVILDHTEMILNFQGNGDSFHHAVEPPLDELSRSGEGDANLSLFMRNCTLRNNAGFALLTTGNVFCDISDCRDEDQPGGVLSVSRVHVPSDTAAGVTEGEDPNEHSSTGISIERRVIWQFEVDGDISCGGNWRQYDKETSVLLETHARSLELLQDSVPSSDINADKNLQPASEQLPLSIPGEVVYFCVGDESYSVDFRRMIQTNLRSLFIRSVRRQLIP